MKISFHGADRGVTGSCHLVECAGKRVLIDCGLYQGGRDIDEENDEPFGFEPRDIDFLLLTHAHLDHCGRIPLLAKRGFRGEIVTTAASRELARIVLLDSAHLNEEEVRRRARHESDARAGRRSTVVFAARRDAQLRLLRSRCRVRRSDRPRAGYTRNLHRRRTHTRLRRVRLELTERTRHCSVLFSGDLGNSGRPLLRDPTPPPRSDVVDTRDHLRRPTAQADRPLSGRVVRGHQRHVRARRQRRHPDVCAGARSGTAVLPARRPGDRADCRASCTCSSIRRWPSRRPRSSASIRNVTTSRPRNCFEKDATRWTFPGCT